MLFATVLAFSLAVVFTAPAAAQTQYICLGASLPPGYVVTAIYYAPSTPCTPAGSTTKRTQSITQPPPTTIPVCYILTRNALINQAWVPPANYLITRQSYAAACDPRDQPTDSPDNAWWLCEKDPANPAQCKSSAVPPLTPANSASFNKQCLNPEVFTWGTAPDSLLTGFSSATLAFSDFSRTAPCSAGNFTLGNRNVVVRDKNGLERSACILYIGRSQVNFVVPGATATDLNASAAPGRSAWVTVRNSVDDKVIAGGYVPVRRSSPGLFTADSTGCGLPAAYVLRVKPGGVQSTEPVSRLDTTQNKYVAVPIDFGPQEDQIYLILFGTGTRQRPDLVRAKVGGLYLPVAYAGPSGYDGLDQYNVYLDRSLVGSLHGVAEVLVEVTDPEAKDKISNRLKVEFR
jgi:uncharacterized protein (TIGR03437 family)